MHAGGGGSEQRGLGKGKIQPPSFDPVGSRNGGSPQGDFFDV